MLRWIVVPTLALAGCGTLGEDFKKYGLDRASFEMQCPKEKLHLVGLNRPLDARLFGNGAQVGVSGCDKRGVYVASPSGWLLNSSSWAPPGAK